MVMTTSAVRTASSVNGFGNPVEMSTPISPIASPAIERAKAERLATVAKSLADLVRMRLVVVLKRHAGEVCVCELVPLFDLSQATVSHHLMVLRDAGLVGSERRGLWAYYYV